jgi:hypothetical protein
MKHILAIIIIAALFSCSPKATINQARVALADGEVSVIRKGESTALSEGMTLQNGDSVVTGEGGTAVLVLGDGFAKIEIQENAEVPINDYAGEEKVVNARSGNIWTIVEKLSKGHELRVVTPASIAAVRGTAFYTYSMDEYHGVCFCQGEVEYSDKASGFEDHEHTGFFAATRDGKTVILTPEELEAIGWNHKHSSVENSPLGGKAEPGLFAKAFELAEEKFAEQE